MRHAKGYRRLNRTHEHRKALFSNMAGSLIEHEQIKTTLPKAKELKRIADKLITLAKRGDLHARRVAASQIRQEPAVKKITLKTEALMRNVRENCEKILVLRGEMTGDVITVLQSVEDPGKLFQDLVTHLVPLVVID